MSTSIRDNRIISQHDIVPIVAFGATLQRIRNRLAVEGKLDQIFPPDARVTEKVYNTKTEPHEKKSKI